MKIIKKILPIILAVIVVGVSSLAVNSIIGKTQQKAKKEEILQKEKFEKEKKEEEKIKRQEKEKKKLQTKVPNLVGLSLEEAKSKIKKYNCKIGKIIYYDSEIKYNTVIEQNPEAEKKRVSGKELEIDIILSTGYIPQKHIQKKNNNYQKEEIKDNNDKIEENKNENENGQQKLPIDNQNNQNENNGNNQNNQNQNNQNNQNQNNQNNQNINNAVNQNIPSENNNQQTESNQ